MNAPLEVLGLINADAELAALSAMRAETEAAVELSQMLEPDDFADPRRAILFEAMRNLLVGPDSIDDAAILAECLHVAEVRSSKQRIMPDDLTLLDAGAAQKATRAAMYANTVKRLAWLRRAGEFAFWLVQELQTRPDPSDLFAEAQEAWQQLAPASVDSRWVYGWDTVKQNAEEIRRRVADYQAGQRAAFDWPWATWTARIRPLLAGMVGIIAAPDGTGKTTYLEQIAEHWAGKGWHTVYVHLEDDLSYKLNRRMARHALVPIDALEDGSLSKAYLAQVQDAQVRMDEWAGCLHYYHAAGETMAGIVRELESRIREGVCQAVVFDYLDKVAASRGQAKLYGDNIWERQAADMEALKTFAERNRLPVMTATQGNKTMQGEGTQTRRSIQGSGQKSQKAQLVLIATREIVGEAGLNDSSGKRVAEAGEYSPVVKLRIDKQNRGKTGQFEQVLLGHYFAVRDIKREGT
jgi:replicative DNA helicase